MCLFSWLKEWGPYIWKAVPAIVLVAIGLILAFDDLSRKIQKEGTYRWIVVIACGLAGVLSFRLDVIARHDAEIDAKTQREHSNTLMMQTQTLLTRVEVLLSKSDLEERELTGMHDLLRTLQHEGDIARHNDDKKKQAEVASKLLALAPGVLYDMDRAFADCDREQKALEDAAKEQKASGESDHGTSLKAVGEHRHTCAASRGKPVMQVADQLRRQLLDLIPENQRTFDDHTMDGVFTRGATIRPETYVDLKTNADYLRDLVARVEARQKP